MAKDYAQDEKVSKGEQHELVKEIQKVKRQMKALMKEVDELERSQRLLSIQNVDLLDSGRRLIVEEVKKGLMDSLTEYQFEPQRVVPKDEVTLLDDIVARVDEAQAIRNNIFDFLLRLLIKMEVASSRTKLLFLSQKHPIDYRLFDDLEQIDDAADNVLINTEEVRLRWKIFEEKVSRELKRLEEKQKGAKRGKSKVKGKRKGKDKGKGGGKSKGKSRSDQDLSK